jgi:hypothetical protein
MAAYCLAIMRKSGSILPMRKLYLWPIFAVFLLLFCQASLAHEAHTHYQVNHLAISVTIDQHGQLWRASVKHGHVWVDKSSDLGKTFTKAVKVNPIAMKVSADGEARPKIAVSSEGLVYLTWTEALKTPYAGYIWFARSSSQGQSFEKPIIVHQDRAEITHRFDALHVAPNGDITVTWVDKRDLMTAKAKGKAYDGAAIYYAVSKDKGLTFLSEQKLADNSCECCRIATTHKPDGTVVAFWRHVFAGSERDHMLAEIPQEKQKVEAHRATFGHWQIDGCPHHGAAIASGGEGDGWWGYHMAYFDGNDKNPGLYYSRMDGVAWASSPAKKFGDNAKQAGHPSIVSVGKQVWLVWREIKDGQHTIWGMWSDDEGRTWQNPKIWLSSKQKLDYPSVLLHQQKPYLICNGQQLGLSVIPLLSSY